MSKSDSRVPMLGYIYGFSFREINMQFGTSRMFSGVSLYFLLQINTFEQYTTKWVNVVGLQSSGGMFSSTKYVDI